MTDSKRREREKNNGFASLSGRVGLVLTENNVFLMFRRLNDGVVVGMELNTLLYQS